MKGLLRATGIINIVYSLLIFLINLFVSEIFLTLIFLYLIISGIMLLSFSKFNNQELSKKKNIILIFSIINFFAFNWISLILNIITYIKISNYEDNTNNMVQKQPAIKEKPKIDPEKRKLDIMLKLGIFLIVLGGFIFATTSWQNISDATIMVLLILLSFVFYGLSIFSKKYLKIESSEILYYILFIIFILYTFISIGNNGLFGSYLSFQGDGGFLYLSLIFILVAGLSFNAYKRFINEKFIITMFISLIISIFFIFNQIKLEFSLFILLNIILVWVFDYIKSENIYVKNLVKTYKNLIYPLLFINFLLINENYAVDINIVNLVSVSASYLIGISYIYLKTIKSNIEHYNVLFPIISIILGISLFESYIYNSDIFVNNVISDFALLIINVLVILLSFINKNNKNMFISTSIMTNLCLLYTLTSFNYYTNEYTFIPLVISSIYLLINIMLCMDKNELNHFKVERYSQPLKVFLLIISLFTFLDNKVNYFESYDFYIISAFITFIVFLLQNNKKLKFVYFILILISTFMYTLQSIYDLNLLFELINLTITGSLFYIVYKSEEVKYNNCKYILYVLSLFSSFIIVEQSIRDFNLNNILLLIPFFLFIILSLFFQNNKKLMGISLLMTILPFNSFMSVCDIDNTIKVIISNMYYIVLIFNITRCFGNKMDIKSKNTIEIILISIVNLFIIFNFEILVGLYIGIINLIFVIAGLNYKNYYSLFWIGLVFTILNIIIQLREVITAIPWPIYLLLSGLTLIGIVIYKEVKKNKK